MTTRSSRARITTLAALLALLALPSIATAQRIGTDARPAPTASSPTGATTAAITPADLRRRLYIFADDSMLGREAGTVDNLRGTAYIERELRRLGLVPAGENGTYFQDVPLVRRSLGSDAALTVGGTRYAVGKDFLVRDNGPAQRSLDGATAVYGGTWPDTTPFLAADAAAGKLVIIGVKNGWQTNRPWLNQRFPKAAAIAVATFDRMPAQMRDALLADAAVAIRSDDATPLPSFLYVTQPLATAMLGAPIDQAPTTPGQVVRGNASYRDDPLPGRNVIAVLPGSDPVLRNQYVAIGAHNDHLGFDHEPVDHDSLRAVLTIARPMGADSPERPLTPAEQARVKTTTAALHRAHGGARLDSIYNGADDDGSGSMAVLEIAENLVSRATKPKRSILFVWHTGEELGLFGSTYFTDHPTVPRDSIVAQLNIDMIGRGAADDVPNGGPSYLQLIGSRRLSTELGDLVETVNTATKAAFKIDYQFDANGHPEQYYCRSDHYEYARYGIPIAFFSTGGHRDYHQVTDEPQYIDYPHYTRVTTLIRDIALRVADLDHRIVVDHAKPDPRGVCRQ
jgi:hypothetical protein